MPRVTVSEAHKLIKKSQQEAAAEAASKKAEGELKGRSPRSNHSNKATSTAPHVVRVDQLAVAKTRAQGMLQQTDALLRATGRRKGGVARGDHKHSRFYLS